MGKKSSKKRKLFTTKQKLIIGLVALVLLLTIIAIALNPTGKKRVEEVKEDTSLVKDFKDEKDVLEYFESIYYSTEISSVEGYDIDVYCSFKYNLYEGEESKESFFKNLYEKMSLATGRKSFRLIDNEKGILIEVKCSNAGIYEVKINGEVDYFRKEDSRRSAKKGFVAKETKMSIDADILSRLISEKWNTKNIDFGTKEGSYYKYDIYFDEGYEVKVLQGRIYNIVFTKNYNSSVVGGYKPGANLERIEADFGKTYEETDLLGYKTKDFYVWFSQDEISIYPIYSVDYSEFEQLAKTFNDNKDANSFMYKITDIWPDYDLYEYNQNYVKISYANKGVQFEYSVEYPIGIKLYENYKGSLRDNISDYPNINYSFDKNLTGEREVARRDTKIYYDDIDEEADETQYSKKFQLLMDFNGERYSKVKIKSRDGKFPNNEFEDFIEVYTYVWADDSHLIYSIYGEGIYLYDAENRTTNILASGKEAFKIENYMRSTQILVYDDSRIKVEY